MGTKVDENVQHIMRWNISRAGLVHTKGFKKTGYNQVMSLIYSQIGGNASVMACIE